MGTSFVGSGLPLLEVDPTKEHLEERPAVPPPWTVSVVVTACPGSDPREKYDLQRVEHGVEIVAGSYNRR